MLKFNSYPPQGPEDIELTKTSRKSLEEMAKGYDLDGLRAFGGYVGDLIITSLLREDYKVGDPENRELRESIAGAAFKEIKEVVSSANEHISERADFGIKMSIFAAQQKALAPAIMANAKDAPARGILFRTDVVGDRA